MDTQTTVTEGTTQGATGSEQTTQTTQTTQQPTQQQTNTQTTQQSVQTTEKTFTQAEVNAMMAREKNEGRRSVLTELGLGNDVDKAKETVSGFIQYRNSQKTEAQLQEEAIKASNEEKEAATARAMQAEAKLTAISKGVATTAVDDVVTIALAKTSKEKPLETVLDEMSKNPVYASFFTSVENTDNNTGNKGNSFSNKGTGTGVNSGSTSNGTGASSLGSRLAQSRVGATGNGERKSNFFSH